MLKVVIQRRAIIPEVIHITRERHDWLNANHDWLNAKRSDSLIKLLMAGLSEAQAVEVQGRVDVPLRMRTIVNLHAGSARRQTQEEQSARELFVHSAVGSTKSNL